MTIANIGVCYYPEHWPEDDWGAQAALMREAGISQVRIAEFAWSRIEPRPGVLVWEWLDRAVEVLAAANLQIIMCTPTACPPRWLVAQLPEILPVDDQGRVREFGSRRHYRFASGAYRREATRISSEVIERYGDHPAVVAWQLDNEYGCHDTTRSYAHDDLRAFQGWLRDRYGSIDDLNAAWGTVFWSQEYSEFDDVLLPNLTVTEANPAHRFDFYRFASEQVVTFNREQAMLIRKRGPSQRDAGSGSGRSPWITHNFMGNFTDFDHFAVARDLDVATWDSYPLGFLDQGWASDAEKRRYRRIGHPDWAAFHHDLYRAVGRGRFGVMEQQPGSVNWAPANAEPLPGAPAYWAMEAIAHGAELVSFFRYQQNPRAQEQMHAALRLPDGKPAPAWNSVLDVAAAVQRLPSAATQTARVALLFDYASCWATAIQAHSPGTDSLRLAMHIYGAARSLGVDLDIIGPDDDPQPYEILLIPGSVFVSDEWVQRVESAAARCLIVARSGSRDDDFALPGQLPPGPLQRLVPLRVVAVDSMRQDATRSFTYRNGEEHIQHWFESVETELSPRVQLHDGAGFWYEHQGHHYLNGIASEAFFAGVIAEMLHDAAIPHAVLPEGLRVRRRGELTFVFNASPEEREFEVPRGDLLIGSKTLRQGAWAVWRNREQSSADP